MSGSWKVIHHGGLRDSIGPCFMCNIGCDERHIYYTFVIIEEDMSWSEVQSRFAMSAETIALINGCQKIDGNILNLESSTLVNENQLKLYTTKVGQSPDGDSSDCHSQFTSEKNLKTILHSYEQYRITGGCQSAAKLPAGTVLRVPLKKEMNRCYESLDKLGINLIEMLICALHLSFRITVIFLLYICNTAKQNRQFATVHETLLSINISVPDKPTFTLVDMPQLIGTTTRKFLEIFPDLIAQSRSKNMEAWIETCTRWKEILFILETPDYE
eukprot:428197-Hanusia_phi.AAC.1